MKIDAEDLMNYHCPRWNELPEIELYIDQLVCILQNNLSIFFKGKDSPVITQNMINNYVKQGVIEPPIKKRYNKTHLACLFVISTFKRIISLSDIREAIIRMQKIVSTEEGYNMFCEELEAAIKRTFNPDPPKKSMHILSETDKREIAMLRAIVSALADSLLVDRLILMRK